MPRPAAGPTKAKADARQPGTRLGELLVQRNLVTRSQLSEALLQQSASGKPLGTLLVELGALDERDLAEVLAEQFAVATVDLRTERPTPEALAKLPESVARSAGAIPIRLADGTIEIAVADPRGQELREQLSRATALPVAFRIAPASDIRHALDTWYRALAGIERHVEAFQEEGSVREIEQLARMTRPSAEAEDAPVVRIVDLVITQALRDRASDVHIEPQDRVVRLRYRIDGALHDVLAIPANMGPAIVSRIKIMAGMNIVERRRSQDGQISTSVDGRDLDIRVSTTATIWGEKAVLRLLERSRPLYRLADLGMPPDVGGVFARLVRAPFGMVLCAGPTGSGKTTTLYATLTEINDAERNIVTIEDPVEYTFPQINQTQINEQAGVTFAGGLKAILRQDPDIILVGEIRDAETARIAVQSALTGHFVLSSLHATDASAALQRFLDMGIESYLIASSVVAVVGQRLVRRICRACRERHRPTSEELAFYYDAGGSREKREFWHGSGCNFCAQSGYQDRIGVFELLLVTDEMKQLLAGNPTHQDIRGLSVRQGMRTLRQAATHLATENVTTISEVMRSIYTL
ncbi:MAG: type II/IV secretion system protein [Acidobacteria bacterium]|nr:type II/IV secretion system protein [Acidobacteriota bacterium]